MFRTSELKVQKFIMKFTDQFVKLEFDRLLRNEVWNILVKRYLESTVSDSKNIDTFSSIPRPHVLKQPGFGVFLVSPFSGRQLFPDALVFPLAL